MPAVEQPELLALGACQHGTPAAAWMPLALVCRVPCNVKDVCS
jgi:hypothetical protein